MSDLKQQLKDYMEETGATQTAIGRAIDYSGATVSQYLSGIYSGDVKEVEAKIQNFLERQTEKSKSRKADIPFVLTKAAARYFDAARICHLHGEMGVVYSDAGLGKTVAGRAYSAQNKGVIFIETDPTYSARVLLSVLHKACGHNGKGSLHGMGEDIIKRLKGSERLIIIDEAENLPRRALEIIRRIGDKTGVGVLLTGMPRLIENLRGNQGDFAQMSSRVGVAAKLEPLKPQDTEKMVHAALPGANGSWKAFHEFSHGNGRRLSKLVRYAPDVARTNETAITREVVEKTAEMLLI